MMRRCVGGALLLGLILFAGSPAQGEMQFATTRLQVGFRPDYAWTMGTLLRNGVPVMNSTSGNGVVIKLQGSGWAGSYRGNETVESVHFSVDGQQVDVLDEALYTGSEAELVRTTVLADAYRLIHTVHIEDSAIWETARFERIDPTAQVEVFYGFLGTRANRLTNYATYDATGSVLTIDHTDEDENERYDLPLASVAVAQYDPLSRDGVTTNWHTPAQMSHVAFLLDQAEDNKYYLALDVGTLPSFAISETMRFFDANTANWVTVGAPATFVLGDLSGNGTLNNFDIEDFELALTDSSLYRQLHEEVFDAPLRGDINGDGQFNNFDIEPFEDLLTSGFAAGSVATVPEPNTGLLAALAAIGVFGAGAARRCAGLSGRRADQ